MNNFRQWLLRSAGGPLALIILMAALLLFLGKDIAARTADIQKNRQELALRSQSLNSLASLHLEAEKAKRLLEAVQALLPPGDQLISFPKNLETLARNNRLGFGFTFDSEEAAKEDQPGVNAFTFTASGPFIGILNFLASIEKGKYFVSFNLFDLQRKEGNLETVVKGEVYSQ